jgi:hypothetical protein
VDASPQVPGVDEFALRKGRSYGTLLVDVEARRPVECTSAKSRCDQLGTAAANDVML